MAESNQRFYRKASKELQWGVVAAIFFIFGILGAVSSPQEPVSAFFIVGGIAGGVAWMLATESGVQVAKAWGIDISQQQNQQQATTSSSKSQNKICSNCGWKNAPSNNYCHDCGEEL